MWTIASRDDAYELTSAIEPALRTHIGGHCRIRQIARRLSDYRSSFALEELQIEFDDGRLMPIIFKNLSPRALLDDARRARPPFLYDPAREIRVYQELLSRHPGIGTAMCYTAAVDPDRERYWLFLEKVDGVALCEVGEFVAWERVAQWLAAFHELQPAAEMHLDKLRLLILDRQHYQLGLERALLYAQAASDRRREQALVKIAPVYCLAMNEMLRLPATLIHGEFYASNILIQQAGEELRVCPVDWETAAWGPALMDLAALIAGGWTAEQRDRLIDAYCRTATTSRLGHDPARFRTALTCCRLHLAVHMLGRSPEWEAPPEHSWNWLEDALELVDQLPY